jgi:hypothetical protein
VLTFDGEPSVNEMACPDCGRPFRRIMRYLRDDGDAYAASFASLYTHGDVKDAYLDVVLGTWGENDPSDHVTFGCRVGRIEGQSGPAASLVPAAEPFGDHPLLGHRLSREEALAHPRLAEFWGIVDHVLAHDGEVHAHVYGHTEDKPRRWVRRTR